MQKDPVSTTSTHANTWKDPASLGFSTWQHHNALSFARGGGSNSDTLANQYGGSRDRGGFRAIYDRHVSFANGLTARRHQKNESTADAGRFVHTSLANKLQRYSYRTAQSLPPVLQRKPHQGQYGGLAASRLANPVAGPIAGPTPSLAGSEVISRAAESGSVHTLATHGNGSPWDVTGLIVKSGISHPVNNISLGLVQRRLEIPDTQRSGRQALPLTQLISEAATIGRSAATPVLRRSGGSGDVLPGTLPSFSPSSGPMPAPMPATLVAPGRIDRKAGFLGVIKTESPSAVPGEQLPTVAAGRSGMGMPGASEKLNQRFNEAGTHHAGSPSSISYVLQRFTDTLFPKATPAKTPSGAGAYPIATGNSDLTHRGESPALTGSARIPVSGHRFSEGQENTHDFIFRRSLTASPMAAYRSPPVVGDNSERTVDSLRNVATHALPGHMQRIPLMEPRLMPKHAAHARGHEGRGGAEDYRGYETGSVPTIQRLHSKTSLFAVHRRATTPQPAGPSAHLPASPHEHHIARPSHVSEDVLQKKPLSLLAAGRGPHDLPGPHIQLSRISAEIAPNRGSLVPHQILRHAMPRSGRITGGIAVSDQAAAIGDAGHILRRIKPSSVWQTSSGSINDRTNYSRTAVADHSLSANTVDTRSNIFLRAFLPLSAQTGVTRSIDTRSVVFGSTDTGSGIGSIARSSTGFNAMGSGSIDSGASSFNSPDIGPVHIASRLLSHPSSISLRRSRNTTVAPSVASDPLGHVNGPLGLKSLAPPRSIQSIHPVMRQTIVRSTEQQPLSISDGRIVSVPETYARNNPDLSIDRPVSPSQSSWTPGSGGRPLAIVQRVQNKLMRESSQGEVPLAAPDRPEDRYGLASPPSGSVIAPVTRAGEANNVSTSRADQADPDEIAERVWQMMAERLVVEHERRGLGS